MGARCTGPGGIRAGPAWCLCGSGGREPWSEAGPSYCSGKSRIIAVPADSYPIHWRGEEDRDDKLEAIQAASVDRLLFLNQQATVGGLKALAVHRP